MQVKVEQPQRYFAEPRQQSPHCEQDEHLGDLVWMIHAVKKQRLITLFFMNFIV